MKAWEATYKGHTIRIEQRVLTRKLFIDGALHAENSGLGTETRLFARIGRGKGWGEPVTAYLRGFLPESCSLVINETNVDVTPT